MSKTQDDILNPPHDLCMTRGEWMEILAREARFDNTQVSRHPRPERKAIMTITTEEAEAHAVALERGSILYRAHAAEALRTLAAERDAAIAAAHDQEIKHMAASVGIDSLTEKLEKSEKARRDAEAEAEKLREALTPSGDTKAEYMGEFSFGFPVFDEDGNETTRNVNVPWTTIKEIMAAIRARAALTQGGDDGGS